MTSDSEHFDKWAGDYDESIEPFLKQFPFIGYYEVLEEVRRLVEPKEGLKVLDVGIGTGLLSLELARAGCDIFGVDFSKKMLGKAAQRIPDARLACVDVIRNHFGEFNGLKFDRIISSYFLHHLDLNQKVAFIKRSVRDNLVESGRLILADIGFETTADHDRARQKWREQWDFEEYYMHGDQVVAALAGAGVEARYKQVSECAGIVTAGDFN